MADINKKRAPLYDTRSYTLENKDLSHGTWFSVVALALAIYSSNSGNPYVGALTSVICYLAVLLSSQRTRVAIPFMLSIALLVPALRSAELLRLVIFSAGIAITPRRRESVMPLFVLLGLWAAFLNSMHIMQLFGGLGFAVTPFYLKLAILDICGFVVLMILLWSKPFPALFGRLPREVDISTVSFVLFFLATIVGSALTATTLMVMFRLDLETLLATSHRNGTALTLIAVALVAIPLSLSVSLNRLVKDFSQKLESIFSSGGRAMVQQVSPKVHEFQETFGKARELIDELDRKVREAELIGKNTSAQFDEREKELIQATKDAQNIASVMSLSPVGFLAVNGSGAILAANRTIDVQFGLQLSHDQIGEHFAQLKLNEEVSNSTGLSIVLMNFVSRILSEQKQLTRGQPLQSYFPLDASSFVHFTVFLFDERIIPVDWKRMSQQLPPSELTIVLFSTVRDDLRSFLLEQLQPNSFEILGGHSIDLTKDILFQLETFDQRFSMTPEEMDALRTCSPDELEAQLRMLIRGVSDLKVAVHSAVLDHIRSAQSPSQPQTEEEKVKAKSLLVPIDLGGELERLLRLFDELLGLSVEANFSFPTGVDAAGKSVRQPITVQAVRPQISRFFATFLSVLSGISKRVEGSALSVTIGTEQIGLGTAALFRGSHPGRYARITVSHTGQSVTTNMLPDSVRHISPHVTAGEELVAALALLSLEIERMNGFFSIQSSPAKGTHITIYIPEDPLNVQKPSSRKLAPSRVDQGPPKPVAVQLPEHRPDAEPAPEREQILAPMGAVESLPDVLAGPPRPTRVLIIGDEIGLRDDVKSCFNGEFDLTIEDMSRESVKTLTGQPDYSGSGFGAQASTDPFGGDQPADLDSFSLIIVPILGELSDGVRLLRDLGAERPILIVAKDSDSADALAALHPVITYPLDRAALKEMLEGIFSSGSV